MLRITLLALAVSVAVAIPKPSNYWGEDDCGMSSISDAGSDRPTSKMIVGGWETLVNEFPWQVSLVWSGSHFCGGSVANSNRIITAAHCVEGDNPSLLKVRVGLHRRDSTTGFDQTIDVTNNVWHEDYDATGNIENDVAVLTLAEDVTPYTDGVQPICPPVRGGDGYVGARSIVSGWGTTRSGGQVTQELRAVDVPIISFADCQDAFFNGWVMAGMICAGNVGDNDKDSCQGDSGGPLAVKNDDGAFELVGIVSWGIGCAGSTPGVYADVQYYEEWLNANLG